MKKYLMAMLLSASTAMAGAQQAQYLEAKTSTIDNEQFGIVKLLRKGERVKVKYFAGRDNQSGLTVYQRYQNWAANKRVIAFSSGTYMDNCNAMYGNPSPIGLCIDQGRKVNETLVTDKLDALAIVFATGGIAVSDLKRGKLGITYPDKTTKTLNIRGDGWDKSVFMDWAQQVEATVFQTHLFIYDDTIKVKTNASTKSQERRFLAVCKEDDGNLAHYIINLPTPSTIYNGVKKAYRILKEQEEVNKIIFMINLDTGCQDVLSVFHPDGSLYQQALLKGKEPINSTINLLAYYYE